LFPLLYTFNRDLLLGEVGLSGLKAVRPGVAQGGGQSSVTGNVSTNIAPPANTSNSCSDPKAFAASISNGGSICGSRQCSALSGCKYQQYINIINQESAKEGVDPAVTIAIMCRESHGDPNPPESAKNDNQTHNCGLMQINSSSACSGSILDPQTNISLGVKKIKQKMSGANQVYKNIPAITGAIASYNCCGNGDIPNAQSRDCNQDTGYPNPIPKWACPINPGTGSYNMCKVDDYVCDVSACINVLKGGT
jgi:hypothetical protein